ncbi:ABC transporter permease subunit [Bacillus sp. DX1.1]|uniref:ABC transporter permease subunit n=1 Tax=unclassified Bacillus (in: firmicutes) TaxID=185979 RepID=UPI0025702BC6|nr:MULTISPECIES: ABC transporter permease subunit [unclassified Bacillus (in: firmicutes)]MDM5154297.1 ABC transporter permease subunit [Bacillus sp. DX1.1]WJE83212.1 ABC transporter permease subunit [Bacillus sp. DX3.1]
MNNFTVLTKKEFVQMIREFKVFWLPMVFIFLGITQPVVSYYLPTILKALGGGQGITIDPSMAAQKGGEILASTVGSQFDQLGIMIIAISMMGVIQGDKANGMLAFILTRPVTVVSYISGKIISNYIFIACSVTLGYFSSYLYINMLFTNVNFVDMIIALLFYLLWVLFMVSFTTMISTVFNTAGVIALISIVFLLGCRIVVGLSPIIDFINPASMSKNAMEVLTIGTVNTNAIWNVCMTLVCIVLTILVTKFWIANKKFTNE